jgi:hypothetical protein
MVSSFPFMTTSSCMAPSGFPLIAVKMDTGASQQSAAVKPVENRLLPLLEQM